MSEIAIRVNHLGKRYRIGRREAYRTLREGLVDLVRAPLQRMRSSGHDTGTLDDGSERYRGHIWALKDVCLDVKRGEVVGIIGRNGAGKTTLLKIASRITEPTEGFIEIMGRIGSLLEVGTGFHPELTGRENIYLNGAILGMGKGEIDRNFDEIVSFAEIENFIDTPVKRYSSGMYVRLAFAVAAHLQAEILLVDEVLAVGDLAFQKRCLGKMSSLTREGRTVLFVSHSMPAITSLCHRAVWLDQGRMMLAGDVEECVSNYVASLREQRQMFEGRILLEGHPGRLKSFDQIVSIHSCELLDDQLQPTLRLKSGCSVRIRIGYRMQFEIAGTGMAFVCAFRNDQKQRIAYCSSDVAGSEFPSLDHDGTVECVLPRIPFFPGTYSMDIGCRFGSAWSDFIYDAVEFELVDGGFYATKLLPPREGGNLLLEYTWNAVPRETR